ncbi:MAG: GldG family protein [Bdellovibrio sp.]|nr:GldG family protein [Bdellovibrio sp.]
MQKKIKRKTENYLKVFLGILSMGLAIYIASTVFYRAKIDLTDEGIYSLSKGSKALLSKLDSPIRLKLYYSKTAANKGTEGLRSFNNYFLYVHDILKEYVAHSRNNLALQIIDPRPDTEDEEEAEAYGLKRFHITETERYFFGLVAISESGSEKIIEFFDPNKRDGLEYEITKLIYSVLSPQKKKVGVLSPLPIVQDEISPYMAQIMQMQGREVSQSWPIINMLREFHEVKSLGRDIETISGIDTLLIIHPTGLSDQTLFAIDQFVLQGGKALVLVDPHAFTGTPQNAPPSPMGGMPLNVSPDEKFRKLMDKWGIAAMEGAFAGDKYLSAMGRLSAYDPPTRLLPLMVCNRRCTESFKDPMTRGLEQLTFFFPGALKAQSVDGITVESFLSTSDKGSTYEVYPHELADPRIFWNKMEDGKEAVLMGMKAFGKFKTAFPDGVLIEKKPVAGPTANKQIERKQTEKKTGILESSKDGVVVVIADVDFIAAQFAFKQSFLGLGPANDNSTLLLNALEALNGNVDLMSVRSKGHANRSFEAIEAIEFEADRKTEKKAMEINGNIVRFEQELAELSKQANQDNMALIQNESLKKKKALSRKIVGLKKELREVKRDGRERVEFIGKIFQYVNTLLMPLFVIIFGIWFLHFRKRKKTHETSTVDAEQMVEQSL